MWESGGNARWKSTWDFAGSQNAQNSLTQELIPSGKMEQLPKTQKIY
jgi:hypothetical protein